VAAGARPPVAAVAVPASPAPTAVTVATTNAVAIAARRVDRLEQLARRIGQGGGEALVIDADVSLEHDARRAVESVVAELGRLDILINNAGVMLLGPAVDAPLSDWQRMVNVNVYGLIYCTHAALPHLLRAAQDSPRQVADLVNISSVAGRTTRPGSNVYNLTKHGVGAFSESLRQEVTRRRVRVSVIEPGAVDTELRTHNRPEIQQQMQQRFAQVELLKAPDIADAVLYIVTRPWYVAINELLVRPTDQSD